MDVQRIQDQREIRKAINFERYSRRYENHPPAARKKQRDIYPPVGRLPAMRYESGSRPYWHRGFDFRWLTDLFKVRSIGPPITKAVDPMGPPRFVTVADQGKRQVLKDTLRYASRNKYTPHDGGGQYDVRRAGRRGEQT